MNQALRWSVVFVLFSVTGYGCESTVARDLDDFCRVATEIEKNGSLTPQQKMEKLDARSSEYARPAALGSPSVWARLDQFSGEDKYKWLVTAARSEGKNDWRCPSYGKLLTAVEFARLGSLNRVEEPTVASAPAIAPTPQPAPIAEKPAKAKKAKGKKKAHGS